MSSSVRMRAMEGNLTLIQVFCEGSLRIQMAIDSGFRCTQVKPGDLRLHEKALGPRAL